MLIRRCLYINLLFAVWCKISSQTTIATAIDTFIIDDTVSVLNLSKSFIIESTLDVKIKQKNVDIKNFNFSKSKLFISYYDSTYKNHATVKYQYLKESIPTLVGPKWQSLPSLSDSSKFKKSKLINKKENFNYENSFFSSGSFFRNINMSSSGGSDLSGGIQMQINGELGDNINISGIISDQDITIQPEGTTKDLDELDKVFLNVHHPNFRLNAGDIFFKDSIESINIQKKLVGLQSSLKVNNLKISSVYSGSKGIFRSLELYGRDGDQGPYQLISLDGSKDIIILSGTEKIWIDGKKLTRGENYDYTIDYSLGRVFFTPKNLIHDDSRIFIEFEYSDFRYEKSFIGGNVKNKKLGSGEFSFGLYEESDIFTKDIIYDNLNDELIGKDLNEVKIETFEVDENGKYVIVDSIFIYDPLKNFNVSDRYTVVFNYDSNGDYKREISEDGQIYYIYLHPDYQVDGDDYYSPYDIFIFPQKKQFGYINTNYSINKYLKMNWQLKGTKNNTNAAKNSSFDIGKAYDFHLKIDSIKILDNEFKLEYIENNRNENYSPLSREFHIQRSRMWNLDSSIIQSIKQRSIKSSINNMSIGNSLFEFSTLEHKQTFLERKKLQFDINYDLLKGSFFNFIKVKSSNDNQFHRLDALLEFHNKRINPYFKFINEEESSTKKFNKFGIGVKKESSNWNINSGIENRINEEYIDDKFVKNTEDIISTINYNYKSNSGWNNKLLLKKRIKTISNKTIGQQNLNYSLADFKIAYGKKEKGLSLNIQGRKERSQSEDLATIFDSVGVGLGQYRYDEQFKIYIPDPNGDYISYNIFTGEKKRNTKFQGIQDLRYNLPWFNRFSNITFHVNTRQNLLGRYSGLFKFYKIDIQNENILLADFQLRSELILNSINSYRFWVHNDYILSGLDPRGNELINKMIYGITLNNKINKTVSLQNEFYKKNQSYIADFFNKPERTISSWWNELQWQFRFKKNIDFDLSIFGGFDIGKFQTTEFESISRGVAIKGKYYFTKRGSIDNQIKFIFVNENNNLNYIPPEASNGFALGKSLTIQSRFQYFITKSFSSIISVYGVDDNRYNKSFNLKGELRAYF